MTNYEFSETIEPLMKDLWPKFITDLNDNLRDSWVRVLRPFNIGQIKEAMLQHQANNKFKPVPNEIRKILRRWTDDDKPTVIDRNAERIAADEIAKAEINKEFEAVDLQLESLTIEELESHLVRIVAINPGLAHLAHYDIRKARMVQSFIVDRVDRGLAPDDDMGVCYDEETGVYANASEDQLRAAEALIAAVRKDKDRKRDIDRGKQASLFAGFSIE